MDPRLRRVAEGEEPEGLFALVVTVSVGDARSLVLFCESPYRFAEQNGARPTARGRL
jgi:hypothetical protein